MANISTEMSTTGQRTLSADRLVAVVPVIIIIVLALVLAVVS